MQKHECGWVTFPSVDYVTINFCNFDKFLYLKRKIFNSKCFKGRLTANIKG